MKTSNQYYFIRTNFTLFIIAALFLITASCNPESVDFEADNEVQETEAPPTVTPETTQDASAEDGVGEKKFYSGENILPVPTKTCRSSYMRTTISGRIPAWEIGTGRHQVRL